MDFGSIERTLTYLGFRVWTVDCVDRAYRINLVYSQLKFSVFYAYEFIESHFLACSLEAIGNYQYFILHISVISSVGSTSTTHADG